MRLYSLVTEERTLVSCLSWAFNLFDFRLCGLITKIPVQTIVDILTLFKVVASSQGSHLSLTKQDFAVKQLCTLGSRCDVLYAKL